MIDQYVKKSFSTPAAIANEAELRAEAQGVSFSEFITEALADRLGYRRRSVWARDGKIVADAEITPANSAPCGCPMIERDGMTTTLHQDTCRPKPTPPRVR